MTPKECHSIGREICKQVPLLAQVQERVFARLRILQGGHEGLDVVHRDRRVDLACRSRSSTQSRGRSTAPSDLAERSTRVTPATPPLSCLARDPGFAPSETPIRVTARSDGLNRPQPPRPCSTSCTCKRSDERIPEATRENEPVPSSWAPLYSDGLAASFLDFLSFLDPPTMNRPGFRSYIRMIINGAGPIFDT